MEKNYVTELNMDYELCVNRLNGDELDIISDFILSDENSVSDLLKIGSFAYCSREVRKLAKLTQKDLAQKLNISENTIYNYENGKTKPSKKTINLVKKELSISDHILEIFNNFELKYQKEKKEIENILSKDKYFLDTILEKIKIKKDDSIFNKIIDIIIYKKNLKFEEINNLINSYIMIENNPNIAFICSNNDSKISIFYGIESRINTLADTSFKSKEISDNIFIYDILFEDFIYKILLPTSNSIKNIFSSSDPNVKIDGIKKEAQNELNKQYVILEKGISSIKNEVENNE